MSNKNSHYATVEQEGPAKCPIMGEGGLNTKNIHQYDDCCNGYFDVKDIPGDKQVCKVIAGIHDQCMKDHISTNHACIIALTFPEFMKEIKDNWLDKNWEAMAWVQLLHMVQGQDQPFHDYHVLKDCTNNWPHATTYCTITAAIVPATGSTTSTLAVAAIVTPPPVVYVTANMQSVTSNDADYSDSDDSNHISPYHSLSYTMIILNTEIPASTVKQIEEKAGPAPLFEPHLWWYCSTDRSDFMPQNINALIDPRVHAVLIHADLINTLLLHHHPLHKPKIIELAMESNGKKSEIVLCKYSG